MKINCSKLNILYSTLDKIVRESGTCFLRANDEEPGEPVTGLFFRPDVFVSLVMTRILKTNKNLIYFVFYQE